LLWGLDTKADRMRDGCHTASFLKEFSRCYTQQDDVLSYHLQEAAATAAAETYTRRHNRRQLLACYDGMKCGFSRVLKNPPFTLRQAQGERRQA